MHHKRWCRPYALDLRKTVFNCISAWGQHTTEAKLLHWQHAPDISVFRRFTQAQNWPHAAPWRQPQHPWDTEYPQTSAGASFRNTERGTAGLNWGNLQSQRQGEEGASSSGAGEEGQPCNVTRRKTVPVAKEKCGDGEGRSCASGLLNERTL